MGADDVQVPEQTDSPAEARGAHAGADVAPELDEETALTDAPVDQQARTTGSLIDDPAAPAGLDEDTPASDAMAERAESSRWLMQLHVEGPKSQFGDAKDPDGIRSDSYWMPLNDLVTDDAQLANGNWGDLCDRLQIVDDDELRAVFPADQQVRQWELVAAEHALPPEWGARTQVSFARIPDNVSAASTEVNPVRYAPWSASGEIRSFPEPAVPMGDEWHTEQFNPSWIHGTPHEVPELADKVIADATSAAAGDPMGTLINIAGAMSDQQSRMEKGVVVTDEAGNAEDFDRRWRDMVPKYDADGHVVTELKDEKEVPVWRPIADFRQPASPDDDV